MSETSENNDSYFGDPSSAEMNRVCETLESIAKSFPPDSVESLAIRDAALAYTVVFQHSRKVAAYQKLRLALGGELSDEMKDDLRSRGIDPDELDNDDQA